MPDGEESIDRIIGRISANVESLVKLQEKRDNDVEGLERRVTAGESERGALKAALEGVMQRVKTMVGDNQQQSIAVNQKLDSVHDSVRRLESQERLSPEARAWVHEQHQAHQLRRQTDLKVSEARATAWTWPAIITLFFAFVTVTVLVISLVHH